MKISRTVVTSAVALVVSLTASNASAQTVAELYEKNCATVAQKASEGCRALAASLPEPRVSAVQSGSQVDSAAWGALADVAGGIWQSQGTLYGFSWEKPGTLLRRDLLTGVTVRYALDGQGNVTMSYDGGPNNQAITPFTAPLERASDGTLSLSKTLQFGEYPIKTVFSFARRGEDFLEYFRTESSPKADAAVFRRLDPAQVAALKDRLEEIRAPAAIRANWGMTADLVGKSWANSSFGTVQVEAYDWLEPGISMVKTTAYVGDNAQIVSKPSRNVIAINPLSGKRSDGMLVLADGSTQMGTDADETKVVYTKTDTDKFKQLLWQRKKNGELRQTYTWTYKEQSGDAGATFDRYLARERADAGYGGGGGGGGFGDLLMGAIMGAANGYANAGGDTAGAIVGGVTGAAIGQAGGNEMLYKTLQDTNARVAAEADASAARLQRTIAQARGEAAPAAQPGAASPSRPQAEAAPSAPAAPPARITKWFWCYGRLQPLGKHGDEYYSNIAEVSITPEQSHQRFIEDGVTGHWQDYLGQVAGFGSSDYLYCRHYDSRVEAQRWFDDEKKSWGHYAQLHYETWFPHY